jgi:hypothetical protein
MPTTINPDWQTAIRARLDRAEPIDLSLDFPPAAKWLVLELSRRNLPFKIFRQGCGVVRVVSPADVCPCCGAVLADRDKKQASARAQDSTGFRFPDGSVLDGFVACLKCFQLHEQSKPCTCERGDTK